MESCALMRRLALAAFVFFLVAAAAGSAADAPRWKVWICKPGLKVNWCNIDMRVTEIAANGKRRVDFGPQIVRQPVDCFYLYPSIPGNTTDLEIGEIEKRIPIIQAARFGQACRVFAPMYRQSPSNTTYADALAAWRDYLAHSNHGRGVVLIGHSQGAYVLERLIHEQIENRPAVRKLLVSAILLGGSVAVKNGSDTGGTFTRLPVCRSAKQTGCVVAYSTWSRTPPADASFEGHGPSQHIVCVNPARPGATGKVPITPVFPWFAPEGIIASDPHVDTLFVALPHKYTARCVTKGSRSWLLVEDVRAPGDKRQHVQEVLSPSWGLHAADVNIALEQLVGLVRSQAAAWAAKR
jgi:pimeloyl-ACP methyl ester carboxylesterase